MFDLLGVVAAKISAFFIVVVSFVIPGGDKPATLDTARPFEEVVIGFATTSTSESIEELISSMPTSSEQKEGSRLSKQNRETKVDVTVDESEKEKYIEETEKSYQNSTVTSKQQRFEQENTQIGEARLRLSIELTETKKQAEKIKARLKIIEAEEDLKFFKLQGEMMFDENEDMVNKSKVEASQPATVSAQQSVDTLQILQSTELYSHIIPEYDKVSLFITCPNSANANAGIVYGLDNETTIGSGGKLEGNVGVLATRICNIDDGSLLETNGIAHYEITDLPPSTTFKYQIVYFESDVYYPRLYVDLIPEFPFPSYKVYSASDRVHEIYSLPVSSFSTLPAEDTHTQILTSKESDLTRNSIEVTFTANYDTSSWNRICYLLRSISILDFSMTLFEDPMSVSLDEKGIHWHTILSNLTPDTEYKYTIVTKQYSYKKTRPPLKYSPINYFATPP